MTAHRAKPTITPERIHWFAEYLRANAAWGIFHVCLDDGNWKIGAADYDHATDKPYDDWPADLRDAADWFEVITPSQRARLERRAREIVMRGAPCPCAPCVAIRSAPPAS